MLMYFIFLFLGGIVGYTAAAFGFVSKVSDVETRRFYAISALRRAIETLDGLLESSDGDDLRSSLLTLKRHVEYSVEKIDPAEG